MNQISVHRIKTLPEYFQAVEDKKKTFEVRFNDRDFKLGDIVILQEWDGIRYAGREIKVKITYLLREFVGITTDFVVFSFCKLD